MSGPYPQREFFASDYGQWQIPSQSPNTYLFSPPSICQVSPPNAPSFLPFATNAPVFIVDATAANSELVTPSAVTNTGSQAGITIAPANNHYSFNLISGTAGLQEVLNQIPSTSPYPVDVVLDRSWYAQVTGIIGSTPAGIIASVAGNSAAYLIDRTTAPWTYYSWNGTAYIVSASNQTAPTLAVTGAGAGTSPSATSIVGTGTGGTIKFTTGTTPTASSAVFTLTWPAIASGGFAYAPTVVITSVGTHAYKTGTVASVAGPPAVTTFTASSVAMAASTAFVFTYSAH